MLTLRNVVARGLYAYLQRPVVLSDQVVSESDMPYIYYQTVQPYMPLGGSEITYDGEALARTEQVETTISYVVCSADREQDFSPIRGDDEALALADRMLGWFGHVGRDWLRQRGIVVVALGNVQNRTAIEVDEVARRYGFDIRLRYIRTDVLETPPIRDGSITT